MKTPNKETTVIVCKNKTELASMCEWVESQGLLPPWKGEREKFPICIGVTGGWTDHMDRALTYVPFEEFIITV